MRLHIPPKQAWRGCLAAATATIALGCDRGPSPAAEKMRPQGIESEFRPLNPPAAPKRP